MIGSEPIASAITTATEAADRYCHERSVRIASPAAMSKRDPAIPAADLLSHEPTP